MCVPKTVTFIQIFLQKPKMEGTLLIPYYIDCLGPLSAQETVKGEALIPRLKHLLRSHSNHHAGEMLTTVFHLV